MDEGIEGRVDGETDKYGGVDGRMKEGWRILKWTYLVILYGPREAKL